MPLATWLEESSLQEEARLLAQVRLLNQVAQAAAGNLDQARILTVSLRELDRHLPLNINAVWLVESTLDAEPALEAKAGANGKGLGDGQGQALLAEVRPACNSLGLTAGLRRDWRKTSFAACLEKGQAQYTDEAVRSEGTKTPHSSFAVPLRAGERIVGVLQSICTRPSGFTVEQIQLLYVAADLLGPAISNCQLFGRLRQAYEELRVTQTQLIQAEKMRALGELAGGMAHEFNNSLCGVLGFLELALWDRNLASTTRGHLESARTCALDAAQTVRRVQDFARQRRGSLTTLLNVNELVAQTVELARHKWETLSHARGLPITVQMETKATSQVSGDATELREVLTNLLFNAVDAMPHGGTLTVRTWNTDADVFLSVQDTGVGIRDADRRRLFEPFFTTKEERGNGLGLSVTFSIVQRHGGDIAVTSQWGQGSTFTVRLPAVATEAVAVPVAPAAPPAAVQGLRVLVVEDEESIRRFLGTCLRQLGHHACLTADAPAALEAFNADRFDLVLTDLGLPGVSGEEVARAVTLQSPGTPVVLLTGWADQLQSESVSLPGVRRILGKPVTIDTLRTTLAEVTRRP